jgi:hypothetical protein
LVLSEDKGGRRTRRPLNNVPATSRTSHPIDQEATNTERAPNPFEANGMPSTYETMH